MREIVLDTETTGLSPTQGDRLVEIACLELFNHMPTGIELQIYLDPEREVPPESVRVHGLTTAFLTGKPKFADAAGQFLAFIGDCPLVIHNAEFDLGFLNAELARIGARPIERPRAIDTLAIARRKFPGAPASLDALCRRFAIDTTDRALHGGLVDVRLLAEVYLELIGGRQPSLTLAGAAVAAPSINAPAGPSTRRGRVVAPTADEEAAHARLVARLKDPLWR